MSVDTNAAGYQGRISTTSTNNSLVHTTTPTSTITPTTGTFTNPQPLAANSWGFYSASSDYDAYYGTLNYQFNDYGTSQFAGNSLTDVANQDATAVTDKYAAVPPANASVYFTSDDGATPIGPKARWRYRFTFGVNVSKTQPAGAYRQTVRFDMILNY